MRKLTIYIGDISRIKEDPDIQLDAFCPEAYKHPKEHVRYIEKMCIESHDRPVTIATHSPYLIRHLINLIRAKGATIDVGELHENFYLKKSEAFIDINNVDIYLVTEDEIISVVDRDEGTIDWTTLSKVDNELRDIYLNIGP